MKRIKNYKQKKSPSQKERGIKNIILFYIKYFAGAKSMGEFFKIKFFN